MGTHPAMTLAALPRMNHMEKISLRTPVEELIVMESMQVMDETMRTMPEKIVHVLWRRICDGASVRDVAREIGCCKTSVRQWEAKGLRCMRSPTRARKLIPVMHALQRYREAR